MSTHFFCDKAYIWSNYSDRKHDLKPQMMGLLVVREIPGYFKQDLGLVKYYSTWPDIQFLPLAGFYRGKKWKAFFAGFQPPPELLKLMEVWVGWSPPRDPVTWKSVEEYNQPKTRRWRNVFFVNLVGESMTRWCWRDFALAEVIVRSCKEIQLLESDYYLETFFLFPVWLETWKQQDFLWCVWGVRWRGYSQSDLFADLCHHQWERWLKLN